MTAASRVRYRWSSLNRHSRVRVSCVKRIFVVMGDSFSSVGICGNRPNLLLNSRCINGIQLSSYDGKTLKKAVFL